MGTIFAIDILTPLGVAISVLYFVVILIVSFSRKSKELFFIACFSTLLCFTGYFLSPDGDVWKAIVNRMIAIGGLWCLFFLNIKLFRSLHKSRKINKKLKAQKHFLEVSKRSMVSLLEDADIARLEALQAEKHFEQIIESAPNAMIMVNAEGKITLVNKMTETLFHYRRDELLNQSLELLVPSRFRKKHPEHRGRFFKKPATRAMGAGRALFGLRKDGVELPVEIGLNPMETDEGPMVLTSIVDISDRLRFEKANAHLAAIVESSDDAIIGKDLQGNVLSWNLGAERLFGFRAEEVVGKNVAVIIPENRKKEDQIFLEKIKKGEAVERVETVRKNIGGAHIDISLTLSPIKNKIGEVVGISSIGRDITRRKRNQDALKRSEERTRLMIDCALDAIVVIDHAGLVVGWNPQAEATFGYRPDEAIGQPMSELIVPPEFREGHRKGIEHFLKTGEGPILNKRLELSALRKGGQIFPIELAIVPILTENNYEFCAFIRDITERKKAEERFRMAIESAPNAMVMVNEAGKIVLVNKMTESLFGYRRDALLDQSIEILVPQKFKGKHPASRTRFFKAPKTRSMGAGRDLFGLRKDGKEVPVEIGLNPVETDEGMFVLASIVDITERKQSEDLIKSKNTELETLLSIIAHDLKEPIRSMEYFAKRVHDTLGNRLETKEQDYLTRISNAAVRLRRLIDDILDLSSARRAVKPAEHLGGKVLIDEALSRLEGRIMETGAQVRVVDTFPSYWVDRIWATQAIYNLIANAIKFTHKGQHPEIEVAPFESEGELGLAVRDRGIGLDSEYRTKIFGLFQRAVGREVEGTGAGLAIVREVAALHNGRAWVQPRAGGGSEFIITFGTHHLMKGEQDESADQ